MPATRFTPEQRAEIILSALDGRRSQAEICREHQITTVTLYRWKEQFLAGGLEAMRGKTPTRDNREQEREISRMRELVGELALANFAMKKGATLSTRSKGGRGSNGS